MKLSDNIKFLRSRMYLLASILIVAAIILYILANRSTLSVISTPSDAIATLDNAPISALPNGVAKITTKPGNHVLKVQADGFVAQIFNLDLQGGRSRTIKVNLVEVPKPILLPLATIADIPVDAIAQGDEDNSIFLLGNSKSAIYKVNFNSDKSAKLVSQVSNPGFQGIDKIIWSPVRDAAIFKKGNSAFFFDFQKYNFVSQQEVKYGDNIGDIAWSPDNSKIAYYYAPAGGEQSIIYADRGNTNIKRALNLKDNGISNPFLAWSPSGEWLLIIPRNSDSSTNKAYLLNAYTTELKTIVETGNNLEAKFSPDGSKIIFTSISSDPANPVRSEVSIMNSDGTNVRDLGVKAIVSKIEWIDNSFIAVATFDPETKAESLFKFNVDSKEKIGFSIPLSGLFVSNMIISKDKKILYFSANNHLFQTDL